MITFVELGNRIATENFEIGEIYTITFTNGNYKTMCCIGVGSDFVMFQGKLPSALFCLTLGTAETVSTIETGGGGSGTMNYNELENKPQINGVILIGNKTASELNLVSQSDLNDYATNASVAAGLASKQDQLTTPQLTAVNSGITSTDVEQIETNKNNISMIDSITPKIYKFMGSGAIITDTIDISTFPAGFYMMTVGNATGSQPSQRFGVSVYMFYKFSNGTIGEWTPVVEVTNAKILSYTLTDSILTINYDTNGYHATNILSIN